MLRILLRKIWVFQLTLYFFISAEAVFGQVAPKYSNEFLAIGIGARALGLGNQQVAFVNDATAGFWNPAGLLNSKTRYQGALMHAGLFAGIANFDFAGFSNRIDTRSTIGISVIRLGIDDIPDTRFLFNPDGTLDYANVRSFSAADYAFIFSYARRFPLLKDFRFGANVKVIHRSAGIFANAWGFGFDVGAQWFSGNWKVGAVLRDVTSTFNIWTINPAALEETFTQTENTLPDNSIELTLPRLILGAARTFTLIKGGTEIPLAGLMLAAEADFTFDGQRNTLLGTELVSIDPKIGLELHYKQTVFLRSGVVNIQKEKDFDGSESFTFQPNFGVGIAIKEFAIDYALTDVGNQSAALYSHVFTLKFNLNKSFNTQPRNPYAGD